MDYIRAELAPQRVIGATTTVLAVGRAFLGNIRLNATSGAIYIFDAASATTPGFNSAVGVIASGTLVLGHEFNWDFANGLVVASPGAANSDFTVAFAKN